MPVARKFLGFDRPALQAAAEFLVTGMPPDTVADFSQLILVLPGRRAARRLLEILVAEAESRRLSMIPPRIETVGQLPEQLYSPQRPFASDFVQKLAWTHVLRGAPRELLEPVVPHPPAADQIGRWLELADILRRQHAELAADGLDFADVARSESAGEGFPRREQLRWRMLAELQARYHALLDNLGLWDVQTARRVAVEKRECGTARRIVLIGTVDMSETLRNMLDQVADQVTALVFAPPSWSDRFDSHGCLQSHVWQELDIPIDEERVHVVEGPGEQAEEVVRRIAALRGEYRADEITVGTADENLVPYLEHALNQNGLASRWGPGRGVSETGPVLLLAGIARYLRRDRFEEFAALVRHPDVSRALAARGCSGDCLTLLDRYHAEHLPARLTREWLGANQFAPLTATHEQVEELLAPLRAPATRLDAWGARIQGVLADFYHGRTLDRSRPSDRAVLVACESLRDAIDEQRAVPPRIAPEVGAAEAIEWLLSEIAARSVPSPVDPNAIEILGWLELVLDDAPALVVAGVNEGYVPGAVNSDLFLPNALRQPLGLLDNARRYARDAYALTALAVSRKQVDLIAGRRDARGDPLVPSRLLFASDGETVARRTLRFLEERPGDRPPPLPGAWTSAHDTQQLEIPQPRQLDHPPTRLGVTSFRAYLACPYRFYLQYIERLNSVDDQSDEIGPAGFGTLLHDVLREFGASSIRNTSDADAIRDLFDQELNRCVRERFGASPMPAVVLQVEQARARLREFAAHQAEWTKQGWEIVHVESPGESLVCSFDVDGTPIQLHGRIDRMDFHRQDGVLAIFDYKTGNSGEAPAQTHLRSGEWIDLQLPLYRHLARELELPPDVAAADLTWRVGYILLPKSEPRNVFSLAEWSDDALQGADERAREVVRWIRGERFWPPQAAPRGEDDFAAICQSNVFDKWARPTVPHD